MLNPPGRSESPDRLLHLRTGVSIDKRLMAFGANSKTSGVLLTRNTGETEAPLMISTSDKIQGGKFPRMHPLDRHRRGQATLPSRFFIRG